MANGVRRQLTILAVLLLGGPSAYAGLSAAGAYVDFDLTAEGIVDRFYYVEVTENGWNYVYLDFVADQFDFASGFHANGTGIGLTNFGKGISINLSENQDPVILTVGGVVRQVPFLRPADSGKQFTYTGTLVWGESGESSVTRLAFVDERFFMIWVNTDGTSNGGFGELNNGQATLALVSGHWLEFSFLPNMGVALGRATAHGIDLPLFDYALVQRAAPSLANISTRGWIGEGLNLTAGTVVNEGSKRLLIRAVGPELANLGVQTAHPNPRIIIFEGQTEIAANDDWSGRGILDSALHVGAFPLTLGSNDAALLLTLESGAYTVQVEGDGPPGEALIEGKCPKYC